MASLILAGDSIYLLVYMRQSYQTSMQEVFDITFTQLGVMNSMFGLLAITAYFAGGWLSDRVATRSLLVFSLFATGLRRLLHGDDPQLPHTAGTARFLGYLDHPHVLVGPDQGRAFMGCASRPGKDFRDF